MVNLPAVLYEYGFPRVSKDNVDLCVKIKGRIPVEIDSLCWKREMVVTQLILSIFIQFIFLFFPFQMTLY